MLVLGMYHAQRRVNIQTGAVPRLTKYVYADNAQLSAGYVSR